MAFEGHKTNLPLLKTVLANSTMNPNQFLFEVVAAQLGLPDISTYASLLQTMTKQINFDKFGEFRIEWYNSKDELDAYISGEDYGSSEDQPGVCFGL